LLLLLLLLLVQMIQAVFQLDVSAKEKRLVVRPGVDDFLDEYRAALEGLPNFLTQVAIAETTKYQLEDVIFQIIYRPQVGYLVRVISTPPRFQPPADFEEFFVLDGQAYYKNETTRELDGFLGDLKLSIRDIEVVVTNKVEAKCLEFEASLCDLFDHICELDVLVGFAKMAQQLYVMAVVSVRL
jgi:DNA mismatch repair protein MSH5